MSFINFLLFFTISLHGLKINADEKNFNTLNRQYGKMIYSYDMNNQKINIYEQANTKKNYRVAIIIDTAISNPPTTGLLYKIHYLSKALIKKGHEIIWLIGNRNFISEDQLKEFKVEDIKVHIIPPSLFYNADYMNKILMTERIDIVEYEIAQTFLTLGIQLKKINGIPTVLVLHDIEDELKRTLNEHEKGDLLNYIQYTSAILADAVVSLTFEDQESRKKAGIPIEKLFLTPIGVEEDLPYKGVNTRKNILLFLGNLFYKPNTMAVEQLINEIMPLVLKDVPDTKLKIVGMTPEAMISKYSHLDYVHFTGRIDREEEFFNTLGLGTIGLCNVQAGSGMNVKVANYAASGLPVIVTPIGIKGYEEITSLSLVPDDSIAISKEIVNLLKNKNLAKQLGEKNRVLIMQKLSWSSISAEMEKALNYAFYSSNNHVKTEDKIMPIWFEECRDSVQILKKHYIISGN